MQTILGAGGGLANALARALTKYTTDIRLVSRNPEKVNPGDRLMPADLLDPSDMDKAVEGSSVVYITIGFQYAYKAWKEQWPRFMNNAIDACMKYGCKMVFFDNVYMYDPAYMHRMTEETPVNPSSKKGKVRAEVAKMITDKIAEGKLDALIARSADFYGPNLERNCLICETVFKPLSQGKKADWLASDAYKHSFTYVPDAAKATALLGNTDDAYKQVWHLPTAGDPPTGKEWVETIAKALGVKPRYRVAPKFLVKILGLFVPIMRETVEMMYQYDRDYIFDSSKFEKRFQITPTPYTEGIAEIVKADFGSR